MGEAEGITRPVVSGNADKDGVWLDTVSMEPTADVNSLWEA